MIPLVKLTKICVFLGAIIAFSSCMSSYNFYTAKTLREGQYALSWDGSAAVVSQRDSSSVDFVSVSMSPGLNLTMRFGTRIEGLDWGFQLHPQAPLGGDVKYQFFGSRKSTYALATGLGFGFVPAYQALRSEMLDYEGEMYNFFAASIPLYATMDLDDRFMFSLVPMYRVYYNPNASAQVGVLHVNLRFRLKKQEWSAAYFVLDAHGGTSLAGTPGFDRLTLVGLNLGYHVIFEKNSPKKKKRRKRRH